MNTIEATAILGAIMLVFVVSLSALSAYSKMPEQNGRTEETRRSWEGSWLILLAFLLILLILVWRVL
jgi:NADH:ubiquinone oxidoreductase subunit 6 (subunit J)